MKYILLALTLAGSLTVSAKNLTVMQYNAENFFDTKHDSGTKDFTYLPLEVKKSLPGHEEECDLMTGYYRKQCKYLDWNEARFTKKIINLSKVIKSFDKSGRGPDIVFLQEVENANVLNKLRTKGLDKLGYRYQVLIEGDDSRGIDVGLISKYPVISSRHHSLIINGTKLDTRGILEVALNVSGKKVVVFINHWPSQNNPAEERAASAKLLSQLADNVSGDLIMATGDFNTLETDSPYSFDYLQNFVDAETEARKSGVLLNPGTHYYRGEWSSLDRIFIHKNSVLKPDFSKFNIMIHPFMMETDVRTGDEIPMRSDAETGYGYSDHLPLTLEFAL